MELLVDVDEGGLGVGLDLVADDRGPARAVEHQPRRARGTDVVAQGAEGISDDAVARACVRGEQGLREARDDGGADHAHACTRHSTTALPVPITLP